MRSWITWSKWTQTSSGSPGRANATGLIGAVVALAAFGCASQPVQTVAPVAAAAAEDRRVDCPELTQVKYPFVECMKTDDGQIVFDSPPQVLLGSQMPPMDPFVESTAFWGN